MVESLQAAPGYRERNEAIVLIATTPKLYVYYTFKNDLNLEKVKELGATIIEYPSNGGSAITAKGDLGIYCGIPGSHSGFSKFIYAEIIQSLRQYGIEANRVNNDLTIHGKKVMGYTSTCINNYTSTAIFIAMHNSTDLINELCLKPKTKDAAGFMEYGITREEVLQMILNAIHKYEERYNLKGGEVIRENIW